MEKNCARQMRIGLTSGFVVFWMFGSIFAAEPTTKNSRVGAFHAEYLYVCSDPNNGYLSAIKKFMSAAFPGGRYPVVQSLSDAAQITGSRSVFVILSKKSQNSLVASCIEKIPGDTKTLEEKLRDISSDIGTKPAWFDNMPDGHLFAPVTAACSHEIVSKSVVHFCLTVEADWKHLDLFLRQLFDLPSGFCETNKACNHLYDNASKERRQTYPQSR